MPIIKIDNKDYDTATLPKEVIEHLTSLQFVDAELQRHQAKISVLQTARIAYVNALKQSLPAVPVGDTIKLS